MSESVVSADDLKHKYNELYEPCKIIMNKIRDDLGSFLDGELYIDAVSGRVKGKESFIAKVMSDPNKYDPPFQQVEDLIGLRVLVYFRDTAGSIYRKIADGFYPNVENRHEEPKDPNQFGYEGFHLIQSIPLEYLTCLPSVRDLPTVLEIQVKTLFMHAWSQPEHLIRYKNKTAPAKLPKEIERKLAWLAATSWGSDSVMLELKRWLEK